MGYREQSHATILTFCPDPLRVSIEEKVGAIGDKTSVLWMSESTLRLRL